MLSRLKDLFPPGIQGTYYKILAWLEPQALRDLPNAVKQMVLLDFWEFFHTNLSFIGVLKHQTYLLEKTICLHRKVYS